MNVTSNGRSRHSFHRRRSSYNSKNNKNNSNSSGNKVKVLSGVTACLSGLDSDHKTELHAIIAHLGGEHSGVLDPAVVTHLVIDDTEGSVKYGWVQQILADDERDDDDMTRRWAKSLKIVTSAWIEACANEGRHVDENLYRLKLGDQHHENNHHNNGDHHFATINDNNNKNNKTSAADDYYNADNDDGVNDGAYNAQNKLKKSRSLPSEIDKNATLEEACDWFIRQQQQNDPYGVQQEQIFSMHSFLLVGFHMDSNNATAPNTTTTATATSNKNDNTINNIEGGGGGTTKSNNSNNNIDKHKRLHAKLSTLVRNAGGVIYWEPNELTTIVLINDDVDNIEYCDDFNQQQQQLHHRHQERTHMFQEARVYCQYHPRGPIAVTPRWILACLHHGMVIDFPSSFPSPPPIPIPMLPGPSKKRKSVMTVDDNNTNRKSKVALPNDKSSSKMKYKQSTMFQGDIFVVIRPQQLPSSLSSGTCLEYTQEEMENTITNAGGLILSKRILEAIKKDLARKRQQQQQQQQASHRRRRKTHNDNNNESESIENSNDKRRYFVVSSGGHSNLHHSKYHPLLGELTKSLQQSLLPTNGADKTDLSSMIEPVSPIWITSCIQEGYVYNPTQYPTLFQPQSYHLRLFPKETKFLVSVTGFVDASRYGIIWMLRSLGAEYTDNLKAKNTHLICCTSVNDENNNHNVVFGGAKYVKAQEWGLHVVTLDWLYHCMRYGYEEGCEDKFLATRFEDKMRNNKKEERNSRDLTVRYSLDTTTLAKEEAPSEKVALRTSTTKLEPKSEEGGEDDTDVANFDVDYDDDETTCLPPQMSTSIKKEEMKSSDVPVRSWATNDSNENVRADPVALKEDVIQTTTSRNSDDDYDAKTTYPSPHRGKRERKGPQASPVNNDSTKRFKSALQTLQSTPTVGTTTSSLSSRRRRGKRDRTPLSQSQLSQQSEESEGYSPEVETQFTIRIDADIGKGKQGGFYDDNVPLSQENEALDNGESQVVWLPFMRR